MPRTFPAAGGTEGVHALRSAENLIEFADAAPCAFQGGALMRSIRGCARWLAEDMSPAGNTTPGSLSDVWLSVWSCPPSGMDNGCCANRGRNLPLHVLFGSRVQLPTLVLFQIYIAQISQHDQGTITYHSHGPNITIETVLSSIVASTRAASQHATIAVDKHALQE